MRGEIPEYTNVLHRTRTALHDHHRRVPMRPTLLRPKGLGSAISRTYATLLLKGNGTKDAVLSCTAARVARQRRVATLIWSPSVRAWSLL